MVKIKLAKFGRKKAPFYRIVAIADKSKREGKPVDTLGYWNPSSDELKFDKEKLKVLVEKGAQITTGVAKLFTKKVTVK
ncbi:MAG: 30S ribosomal protein S16 [Patescibacteria group bacterium]